MSLTTWMQSLWKVPPVGKLALNNLHKMKRPLKLNIWQDSCVHSAIFDYYMRRSILTLNLSKQQKVRIFLWICCSKTYRFFVFWFRFKVTFVLLVLWGEGGVLVAIVFCVGVCCLITDVFRPPELHRPLICPPCPRPSRVHQSMMAMSTCLLDIW